MGLLSGSISVTRLRVLACPEEPDFAGLAFTPLPPGSERRESIGFVPFAPEAPYAIGARRFAFRIRIDRLRPDPTAVAERLAELERAELAGSGLQFVGRAKRQELRALASEEIVRRTAPRSQVVEGVIDGPTLWLGTTAKARLGTALLLLREGGVLLDYQAPWVEAGEPEPAHPFVTAREPGQSVRGCAFLRALLAEGEVIPEPLRGAARLQTPDAMVGVTGAVIPELDRLLAAGAEPLAVRLLAADLRFRFDALGYRVSGLALDSGKDPHWTDRLAERLEKLAGLFALLDAKYAALRETIPRAAAAAAAV